MEILHCQSNKLQSDKLRLKGQRFPATCEWRTVHLQGTEPLQVFCSESVKQIRTNWCSFCNGVIGIFLSDKSSARSSPIGADYVLRTRWGSDSLELTLWKRSLNGLEPGLISWDLLINLGWRDSTWRNLGHLRLVLHYFLLWGSRRYWIIRFFSLWRKAMTSAITLWRFRALMTGQRTAPWTWKWWTAESKDETLSPTPSHLIQPHCLPGGFPAQRELGGLSSLAARDPSSYIASLDLRAAEGGQLIQGRCTGETKMPPMASWGTGNNWGS